MTAQPKSLSSAVDEFKAAFIHWIVESNIPLSAVQHDTFQRLLRTPNHIINAILPSFDCEALGHG
ncbi:hypothetical protein BGZ61DRAFT_468604 [Ilyonectria robusta]|uniref:uncharacterized protein n=1 Tax=Ilyonectria robusta TaxID=1079257 RepID=UPI001E8CD58A|nr:uncharacterized protein BGZ61DRAFT_468604 [Ilyonectria robusta]KAH8652825.1 hypothetical protein BGZ61DRAFT_468604 [Ilyonectria robusta]